MAKKKKAKSGKSVQQPSKPTKQPFQMPAIINKYRLGWIVLLLLVLLTLLYHQTAINGKPFLGGDTLGVTMCYKPFINDALDREIYPQWNPYIFSGMPSFASLSSAPRINLLDTIINKTILAITSNDIFRILFNLAIFGLLMFLLMRRYKVSIGAALFAALAVVFMPQFTAFAVHGHNTKLLSLMLIPLILYLLDQLLEKRNLMYMALLALTLGFQLFRAHVQVCYYTYILIGFYFLFYAGFEYQKNKCWSPILKSAGLLLSAGILALALSSIINLSVYEYSHYSIRGGGTKGGLDYNYATGWSFSPLEMFTFLVPGFVGFGSPTYWGPMSVTNYPLYFSIIVLFLSGFAIILKRNRLVWLFSFVSLFSLLVSFGKNFPVLYYPMFKWLPFFNKLRIPSMIHIILDLAMVILAAIGIQAIINLVKEQDAKLKEKLTKQVMLYSYIFVSVCGVLFLYLAFGKDAYIQFAAGTEKVKAIVAQYSSQGYTLSDISRGLLEPAYKLAQADAFKMIIFILVGFAAIWGFIKGKVNEILMLSILCIIVVADLWMVDSKIINDKLEENKRARIFNPKAHFQPTPAVNYLKEKQSDDIFRFYPIDDKDANWYMYHEIQTIYGYNPAKLRLYQEMLESFYINPQIPINANSFKMLCMLNVKYLTSPREMPGFKVVPGFENARFKLMENEYALPRAYFVIEDTVIQQPAGEDYKTHRDQVYNCIKSEDFNPTTTAVLEEEPPFAIQPSEKNHVEITNYDIQLIELNAQVDQPAHLVLSEIYYPAGWKVFVDGKEEKIYKTNYLFRSVFLQPGSHKIRFVFDPFMFNLGMWLSLGTLVLLLGIVAIPVVNQRKTRTTGEAV